MGEPDASGSPFCLYSNRPLKMTVFDDPRQKIRTKPLQTCQPLSANYFFNCEGDTFIGIFHFMKSKDSRERRSVLIPIIVSWVFLFREADW